jgi:hypothetical protein
MFNEAMRFPKALLLLIFVKLFLLFLATTTIYYYFYSSSNYGHSFTQHEDWQEYHRIVSWDSIQNAQVDLDADGVLDIVTFEHCVFLSSLAQVHIPSNAQCAAPTISRVAFPDRESMIGQIVVPAVPFRFDWLRHSFLVKDWDNTWYLYDINGFQIRKYQLAGSLLFEEVNPTHLDRFDAVTYQITHLGVALSVVATYLVKHFYFIATK